MGPKRRIYWVERLCVESLCHVFWPALRGRCAEIRYLQMTKAGALFVCLLRLVKLLRTLCARIDGSLGTRRSEDGSGLRYEAERCLLHLQKELSDRILAEDGAGHPLCRRYDRDRLRVHLENCLAVEIWPVVILAHVADWHRRQSDAVQALDHVILGPNKLTLLLRPYFQDRGLKLDRYGAIFQGDGLLGGGVQILRLWGTTLKRCARYLWHSGCNAVPAKGGAEPQIAVEYVWGTDLQRRSDLYWLPESGIAPERVLVYFTRPDRPATRDVLNGLASLGARAVTLSRWKPPSSYFRQLFRTFVTAHLALAKTLFKRIPYGFWQWDVRVRLARDVDYWEAFFRAFGVRVHMSHSFGTMPRTIAVGLTGGIDVCSQYSHIPFITAGLRRAHHVFFVWGPYYQTFFRENQSRIDALVSCGYIFDHLLPLSQERAQAIRQELIAGGAHYIICLLDSTFTQFPNNQTRDMVVAFYRAFIMEMLGDQRLGLVIKPKVPDLSEVLPELRSLLTRARETGRCALLDQKQVTGTSFYTPLDASLASDVAAGGVHINTAALEAALAGVPAMHIDLTGHRSHPFYSAGYGDFVFDDLNAALEAIRMHRRGLGSLGNHAPVLSAIDPFQDGQAARRVGGYIGRFLNGIDMGKDRSKALQQTNTSYLNRWANQTRTESNLMATCL